MKRSILFISVFVVAILVWSSIGLSAKKPKKIGQEEHWVAYDNGTVLDTETKLVWPSISSKPMNWKDAKNFTENFKGGGYSDWRLPTAAELETIMDPWLKSPKGFKLTKYIDIQACCPWASERKPKDNTGQYRKAFDFSTGLAYFANVVNDSKNTALPVRDSKK